MALALLVGNGCEGVALMGRKSLILEPTEVVARVARVDNLGKEIHLRANPEGINLIAYGDDLRVLNRGREHGVDYVEPGDLIAVAIKEDAPGRYRSDFLTIRERSAN